jgi:hypothetical protein
MNCKRKRITQIDSEKVRKTVYNGNNRTMFLFSNRLKASRNSFFFSPVKSRFFITSLTGTPCCPKFSFFLWRCFTIDFSSFPHRQVVLRIKTTSCLSRVCSVMCRSCKPPFTPHRSIIKASLFLSVCVNNVRRIFW